MDLAIDDNAEQDQLALKGDHHPQHNRIFGVTRYYPFACRPALIDHSLIEPYSLVVKRIPACTPYFGLDHLEQSVENRCKQLLRTLAVGARRHGAGRGFDLEVDQRAQVVLRPCLDLCYRMRLPELNVAA